MALYSVASPSQPGLVSVPWRSWCSLHFSILYLIRSLVLWTPRPHHFITSLCSLSLRSLSAPCQMVHTLDAFGQVLSLFIFHSVQEFSFLKCKSDSVFQLPKPWRLSHPAFKLSLELFRISLLSFTISSSNSISSFIAPHFNPNFWIPEISFSAKTL